MRVVSWTAKAARARTRRKLKATANHLNRLIEGIAYDWGDVDNLIVCSCDELRDRLQELQIEIEELMTERVEWEEQTGDAL